MTSFASSKELETEAKEKGVRPSVIVREALEEHVRSPSTLPRLQQAIDISDFLVDTQAIDLSSREGVREYGPDGPVTRLARGQGFFYSCSTRRKGASSHGGTD